MAYISALPSRTLHSDHPPPMSSSSTSALHKRQESTDASTVQNAPVSTAMPTLSVQEVLARIPQWNKTGDISTAISTVTTSTNKSSAQDTLGSTVISTQQALSILYAWYSVYVLSLILPLNHSTHLFVSFLFLLLPLCYRFTINLASCLVLTTLLFLRRRNKYIIARRGFSWSLALGTIGYAVMALYPDPTTVYNTAQLSWADNMTAVYIQTSALCIWWLFVVLVRYDQLFTERPSLQRLYRKGNEEIRFHGESLQTTTATVTTSTTTTLQSSSIQSPLSYQQQSLHSLIQDNKNREKKSPLSQSSIKPSVSIKSNRPIISITEILTQSTSNTAISTGPDCVTVESASSPRLLPSPMPPSPKTTPFPSSSSTKTSPTKDLRTPHHQTWMDLFVPTANSTMSFDPYRSLGRTSLSEPFTTEPTVHSILQPSAVKYRTLDTIISVNPPLAGATLISSESISSYSSHHQLLKIQNTSQHAIHNHLSSCTLSSMSYDTNFDPALSASIAAPPSQPRGVRFSSRTVTYVPSSSLVSPPITSTHRDDVSIIDTSTSFPSDTAAVHPISFVIMGVWSTVVKLVLYVPLSVMSVFFAQFFTTGLYTAKSENQFSTFVPQSFETLIRFSPIYVTVHLPICITAIYLFFHCRILILSSTPTTNQTTSHSSPTGSSTSITLSNTYPTSNKHSPLPCRWSRLFVLYADTQFLIMVITLCAICAWLWNYLSIFATYRTSVTGDVWGLVVLVVCHMRWIVIPVLQCVDWSWPWHWQYFNTQCDHFRKPKDNSFTSSSSRR